MSQNDHLYHLDQLKVGEDAKIVSMNLPTEIKMKLVSYGLTPGDTLKVVGRSPLKGPISIQTCQNERIAVRREHASFIQVRKESNNG